MERRNLNVELREGAGKGRARKLRRAGNIPGIFYGPKQASTPIKLDPNMLYKALETKSGYNTLLDLQSESEQINGKTVMLKDYQADPLTEEFIHIDLIEVDLNNPLKVSVPIQLKGTPAGVTVGGSLEHLLREIELSTLPALIPDEIVIDVSKLEIGGTLHVSDIQVGDGIEIITPKEEPLVTVSAPSLVEEEKPEEEEAEEGEETEKPDEGEAPSEDKADKKADKKKE